MKKKIAIVISCLATISIYLTIQHYRKRRNTKSTSCYLHSFSKPQFSFKRLFLDNSFSHFKHLQIYDSSSVQSANVHPYETEILKLLNEFPISFSFFDEIQLTGLKESFVWVNSESQLQELVELLGKQKVFAVDTEQHSLRSFLGFTALVQISTKEEDYVIDTIALHDVMDMLRSVFADPHILKVFHGADNDILWLQRDFHIYVVNLFDTAKACEVLSKPQKSLAYLLETYCGVTTNKLLQREDWRQRPLSEEMIVYARSDAHYLLYISRCLIEELRVKGSDSTDADVPKNSACQNNQSRFLIEASRRSNTSCLQLYAKESEELPGESAASSILSRNLTGQGITSQKSSDAQFQNRVRRLCAWRDLMARIHDESLRYVLSDMAIVAIADKNPTSEKKIYDTIVQADQMSDSPSPFGLMLPSPIVCSHWEDVLCLLKDCESTSDDIFRELLKKHLGPNGTCPLSIYNYNLLSKCNWKLENRSLYLQNVVKNGKQGGRKSSRELFVKKFSCKAPVYHNCRIYASDGRLLCYCDKKKLDWYISRNLAKLVDESPPAIMLLFEPKGRPEDEDNDFYIQSKRNMCVGCGERNHYLRYRIIPSCYRVHFPEHLKSHRSHDIVLLCVDCHEVAHAAAEKYKRQIAKEFGIPLYVKKVVDSKHKQLTETSESDALEEAGVSPLQLRTAAMALLRHGQRMPPKRCEELMEIVKTYYGGRDVSHEDLEAALLVGMSPHERRKFEKKKGLSIKLSAGSGPTNSLETNGANASLDTTDQTSIKPLSNELETKVEKPPSLCSDIEGRASTADDTAVTLCSDEISDVRDVNLLGAEGNCESGNLVNGTHKQCVPGTDEGKYQSKVSLLGHGPHGKQVVTHLLKNYGEDGVRQFCQRWRQVFFDAVNPRFLPAGWDIKHSGRRDFGEFSVYKPAKKLADANEG